MCVLLYGCVFCCILVCSVVCVLVCSNVWWCVLIFIVCWCVGVFCFVLMCSVIFWCVLGVCVFWCVLVCVTVHWRVLMCDGVLILIFTFYSFVSPKTLEILSHCRVNSRVCVPRVACFKSLSLISLFVVIFNLDYAYSWGCIFSLYPIRNSYLKSDRRCQVNYWLIFILQKWISQPQVIKFTSCLSMVSGSLRVLRLLPPLKLVATI